jgi:hypothetical protein
VCPGDVADHGESESGTCAVPHGNRIGTLTCRFVVWSMRVGAENRVTLCDLPVFVDASTEAIAAKDVKTTAGFWDRSSTRWRLTEHEVPRAR